MQKSKSSINEKDIQQSSTHKSITIKKNDSEQKKINGYRGYGNTNPVKWRNYEDAQIDNNLSGNEMEMDGINMNSSLNLSSPHGQSCSSISGMGSVGYVGSYQQMDDCDDHNDEAANGGSSSTQRNNDSKISEEMKISRILRKLLSETNTSAAVVLCEQLQMAVQSQANVAYLRRSYDFVFKNLLLALKQCPLQCLETIGKVLGYLGYINRKIFQQFMSQLFKEYEKKQLTQKYIMLAFRTALRCDAQTLYLTATTDALIQTLKIFLENTEDADTFMSICDVIMEFSNNYNAVFDRHFKDVVDIIVGWHLETEQSTKLKYHCSEVLQRFSFFFLKHLDFSMGLLGQFLEDITGFGEDIIAKNTTKEKQMKIELRIGAFIGAFNTILKTLVNNNKMFDIYKTLKDLAIEGFNTIHKVTIQNFEMKLATEEDLINVNDFLCLLYEKFQDLHMMFNIQEIVEVELQMFDNFSDLEVRSLLFLIYMVCKHMQNNLPLSFVTLVLKNDDNPMSDLKLARNHHTRFLFLKIHQEILMIKNVPLLQEAYSHIQDDIGVCIESLQTTQKYHPAQAEAYLMFYLAALTSLASQTSSIIIVYALSPSLLELFVERFRAADLELWSKFPTTHEAVLELLLTYCQKNNNFRATSRLLNDQDASASSPSSEHFTLLLKFLAEIMTQTKLINDMSLKRLLQWLLKFLEDCQISYEVLGKNEYFKSICNSLALTAERAPLEVFKCLSILLKYKRISNEVLEKIRDACFHMIDSPNPQYREAYCEIFALLPLSISLLDQTTPYLKLIKKQQQLYNANTNFAPLKPHYFKTFLDLLDPEKTHQTNDLPTINAFSLEVFLKSWCLSLNENLQDYAHLTKNSSSLANSWLQFEAARYCVQNKLKTIIGKPQQTFLAIEAIVMKFAKMLSTKKSQTTETSPLDSSGGGATAGAEEPTTSFHLCLLKQTQCRMLLGFLENLEKLIYNASDGTAFAIAAAEKPARTFFRVNASTCNEWFKRIRNAVCMIATHCMEPEMIIRYCENLPILEKLPDPTMEHYLLIFVSALLTCGESDTLQGLANKLKASFSKKYIWIQYVADQAAFKKETAIEGYEVYLKENERLDNNLKDFLLEQLVSCYSTTGQWLKLKALQYEMKALPLPLPKYDYTKLSKLEKYFQQYASFNKPPENGDIYYKLSQWSLDDDQDEQQQFLAEGPNTKISLSPKGFSIFDIQEHLEEKCLPNIYINTTKEILTESLILSFQESLLHSWHDEFKEFVILNHIKNFESFSSILKEDVGSIDGDSTILMKYLYLSLKAHQRQTSLLPESFDLSSILFLNAAVSARDEGNTKFAYYILEQFLRCKGYSEVLQDKLIINVADPQLVKAFIEISKLLNLQPAKNLNDTLVLLGEVAKQSMAYSELHLAYAPVVSEVLFNIAEHIVQRPFGADIDLEQLNYLIVSLPEDHVRKNSFVNAVIPAPDFNAGKMLNASVLYDPNNAEAWYAYGNWCYRWGKKIIEPNTTALQKAKMTHHNLEEIRELYPEQEISENDLQEIVSVLNKYQQQNGDLLEEIIDANDDYNTEDMERRLKKLSFLTDKSSEYLYSIIRLWQKSQKTIYSYYEVATKAYFRYLALKSAVNSEQNCNSVGETKVEDSTFVTTTLRLLRLIVKHAVGLQEVIEEGFNTTPLKPWKVIIPQLFSRLNHHEPCVRKCVSELLCRLATLHSHLIIFPTVVGAEQHQEHQANNVTSRRMAVCFNELLQTLITQAPDTVSHVKLLVKELRRITLLWEENWLHYLPQIYSDYSPLINSLDAEIKKNKNPNLQKIEAKYHVITKHVINDLEKLHKITSKTPETNYERHFQERFNSHIVDTIKAFQAPFNQDKLLETWLNIKKLYNVFQQRSSRGFSYVLKSSELSPVLARMSNTAIAMPGVDTNDQIYIRSVDPNIHILPTKTKPKKLAFLGSDGKKYTYLFKGLEDLHLDERIMQFLSISNSMMARSANGYNNTMKSLFKAQHYSVIPLGPQSGLISWVDGVTPIFAIYKKWQQREAVMKQQLKERNNSLKAAAAANATGNAATTETAQQQPLQPQQQQQAAQQQQQQQQLQQQQPDPNIQQQFSVTPVATRPSELFFQKLTPLLAEVNMKVTDPRKQWPASILKQVFKELCEETPKDLLAKEIWCHSVNASEWRKAIRNYSISVAVMSVIGYIIGLGDRHLDNVLIKLTTGEIVHIDYNVCFEKGRSLRIPEKVPFRMTQNMEAALGITGVEGAFRLGCEHVLKVLRKEKETLLTLLEAFVYDPLVDWTIGDENPSAALSTTSSKPTTVQVAIEEINKINACFASNNTMNGKDLTKTSKSSSSISTKMDSELAKKNILKRFEELKPLWKEYINDFIEIFEETVENVHYLETVRSYMKISENEKDLVTKQLAFIEDLGTLGSAMMNHSINTVSERFKVFRKYEEAYIVVREKIEAHRDHIEGLINKYYDEVIAPTSHDNFMYLQMNLNAEQQKQLPDEFEEIMSMLKASEEYDSFAQCEQIREEMNGLLERETVSLLESFELLMQYVDVMRYYPRKNLKQNPLMIYKKAYDNLLATKIDEDFENRVYYENFQSSTPFVDSTTVMEYANSLLKARQELGFHLQKALNDLKEHKVQMLISYEVATTNAQKYIEEGEPTLQEELQLRILNIFGKTNDSFASFEATAFQSYLDPLDLLDQEYDYINTMRNITEIIFPYLIDERQQEAFTLMTIVQSSLDSLHKLKTAFILPLPERIFQIYMYDDNDDLQDVLTKIHSVQYLKNLLKESNAQMLDKHPLLAAILRETYNLFKDNEINIMKLLEFAHTPKYIVFPKTFLPLPIPGDLKYELISELFQIMHKYTKAFKEQSLDTIYDPRCLVLILKDYIRNILQKNFNGLTSLCVRELKAALGANLEPSQIIDTETDTHIQAICDNLLVAEQQNGLFKQHQREVLRYTKWLDHLTLISTAHNWLHIQYLLETQYIFTHVIFKNNLLKKIYNSTQTLSAWKQTISSKQKEIENLSISLDKYIQTQVDNNDKLIPLHEDFIKNSAIQKEHVMVHTQILDKLIDYAMTLLQFERFNIFGEEMDEENTFDVFLTEYKEASGLLDQSRNSMTLVEKALVTLLDPEGPIDRFWLDSVKELLDDMLHNLQSHLADLDHDEKEGIINLLHKSKLIDDLLDNPTRTDIRFILKSIFKKDKSSRSSNEDSSYSNLMVVRDFQQGFKSFFSSIGEARSSLISEDFSQDLLNEIRKSFSGLKATAEHLDLTFTEAVRTFAESCWPADPPASPLTSINEIQKVMRISGQEQEQKRNSYGVSVWKRVRMKLEGRDTDAMRRSSVSEQVDHIIQEATDVDNLAALYEGWTPWV